MQATSVQDFYPDDFSHCYGCGRLNTHGLHIRTRWDGSAGVCVFEPRPEHVAIPGFVYGGLIASLIDCHCIGTAAAAAYRAQGREMGSDPALRFVTASLQVDYVRPTPMGCPLEVRARAEEIKERKVVLSAELLANGVVCARGRVVAVQLPETLARESRASFTP
ncbi:MAG TPA: PaaI family thioesterase [Candidatus Polarisedimenticolaceae bacterium]|nr:PaaI family thioesterase [Candidatus Polarisedimenticolaceae bacterium]